MIVQTADRIPVDERSAERYQTVHDKLAIDNRYKAMRLQAENEVKRLNAALEERRDLKQAISQNIIETHRGLVKPNMPALYQPLTPALGAKQKQGDPDKKGFVYHENQFRSKTCISRVTLQPIERHQERILKIKQIQFGAKFVQKHQAAIKNESIAATGAEAAKAVSLKSNKSVSELNGRPPSMPAQQSWNYMTSPRSPKSLKQSWRMPRRSLVKDARLASQ